jgi:hypothetical protein
LDGEEGVVDCRKVRIWERWTWSMKGWERSMGWEVALDGERLSWVLYCCMRERISGVTINLTIAMVGDGSTSLKSPCQVISFH